MTGSRLSAGVVVVVAVAALVIAARPAFAADFPADAGSLGPIPDALGDCDVVFAGAKRTTFTVSGVTGRLLDVRISLGLTHPHAGDLAALLFAPDGSAADLMVMASLGGPPNCREDSDFDGNYVFSDGAPATPTLWEAAGAVGGSEAIASGSYRASDGQGANDLITPAFAGLADLNGTWELRIYDLAPPETGAITAATLSITTVAPTITGQASPSVPLGGEVTDTVTLTGGNAPQTGTVFFALTGPDDPTCQSYVYEDEIAVVNGMATTTPFAPDEPGTYRWLASYSGDASNGRAETRCDDPAQQVTVGPAAVQLTTQATATAELGQPITDVATLAGGVDPTGTLTFEAYGPGDAGCTRAPAFTSSVTVTGNGEYTSEPFTPAAAGTYRWIASYSGDPNDGAATGACGDAGEVSRVGGGDPAAPLEAADNVERAIAWSQLTFPGSGFAGALTTTVLLGRDDVFADSLASGGAQGVLTAPLLLTGRDALDPRTAAELERLGAAQVVLLGGEAALSAAVEQDVEEAGYTVRRLFGAGRVETAVAIAGDVAPDARTVVIARAGADPAASDPTQGFADALAGGALAARLGVPLLLSDTAGLSAATADYLDGRPVTEALLLGGTAALSQVVADDLADLDITPARLGGASRAETAVAIATDGMGLADAEASEAVLLVDGQHPDAWADAFPAALQAARGDAALLLTSSATLPPATTDWLVPSPATLTCGSTVTPAACADAAALLQA